MKELTIKEKAERYDEAINVAKSKIKNDKNHTLYEEDIINIFPELKKSEDEKIRKELIKFLKSASGGFLDATIQCKTFGKWAAWLEKQGKQKHKIQPKFKIGDIIRFKGNETLKGEAETHKIVSYDNELYVFADGTTDLFCEQDMYELVEQNPTDKVKPKFHKGEWVVWNNQYYKVNYNSCGYELVDQNGLSTSLEYGTVDKSAHVFSIKDAKEGDVLMSFRNQPFIYNGKFNKMSVGAYCGLTVYDVFTSTIEECNWTSNKDIKPATKEERDTLMKVMTDAGYTFDFEKKELKKIEQKSIAWSEEDENNILFLTSIIEECFKDKEKITLCGDTVCANFTKDDVIERLKSLRPQKQWLPTVEQAKALSDIIRRFDLEGNEPLSELKEQISQIVYMGVIPTQKQWKPSEEQIGVIEAVINNRSFQRRHLDSLYEQLKKLREE